MNPLKYILSLICLLSGAALSAQETYNIELGQFERLKIDANVSVVYHNLPDSTGFARYTTKPGSEKLFILTLKGNGTLRIQLGEDYNENLKPPVLYLYSDLLSSVESSSDLSVFIANPAPCATFNANQTGNGSIIVENLKCNHLTAALTTGNGVVNISGSCLNANYRMVGTGTIYADRMKADNVNCKILGTGNIGCWAIDNLTVKGLGTTKIYYKGSPNIKKTGGGKLFQIKESNRSYEQSGVEVTSFDNPKVNEKEAEEDVTAGDDEEDELVAEPPAGDENEDDDDDFEEDDEIIEVSIKEEKINTKPVEEEKEKVPVTVADDEDNDDLDDVEDQDDEEDELVAEPDDDQDDEDDEAIAEPDDDQDDEEDEVVAEPDDDQDDEEDEVVAEPDDDQDDEDDDEDEDNDDPDDSPTIVTEDD